MKLPFLSVLVATVLFPLAGAFGKPPPPKPTPATGNDEASSSLLRWLLLQNGGATAAAVPFPDIVRAACGKQVMPPDAAVLAKLGATLDGLLPRLNKPDGTLRTAPVLTAAELSARVADEVHAALPADKTDPADACPVLRWTEAPGGRTVHLIVATYPTGGKDGSLRTLSLRAADLAGQITADGPCLLVGIEHNGKTGRDVAFLNWEIIDLARVSLRCAVTFETDADGLHVPGATLGDGRRGRD